MRYVMTAGFLLTAAMAAGTAQADHTQRLGELSVCYEPLMVAGRDFRIDPKPVLHLYGDLQTGEVLGARIKFDGTPARQYTAHGRMLQALDRTSHASGIDPASHFESAFTLTYVDAASWVSFFGDIVLSAHGADSTPIRVECYDRNTDPDIDPPGSRYFVVGVASTTASPWVADPSMAEDLKPLADQNAQHQCAGAVRESEYIVTFEPIPTFAQIVILVSAHYSCGSSS